MSFSRDVKEEIKKTTSKNKSSNFLREAFLKCGSVAKLKVGYHLEFFTHNFEYATEIIRALEALQLNPQATRRHKSSVIYLKSGKKITKILKFLGANNNAAAFEKERQIKEIRNYVNRSINFETANLSKTIDSAAEQVAAIKKLKEKKSFENLPGNLKEIANLRLIHPDASLRTLGNMCIPKISRSGANHRIQKLMQV